MVALSVQALLLMAVAYFLGAALACMIRRSLSPAAQATVAAGAAERRVDPLPEVAQRNAQAAALAAARATAPAPTPVAPPVVAATLSVPPPSTAPAPVASGPQDLKCIQGIDAATEERLNALGISRFEQIAAWKRADVDRISQALGKKGRVARENWIEQAQILARGGQTLFSLRRARGEGSTAVPTPDEGVPGQPGQASAAMPLPMSRVGVAAVVIAPPPAPPPSPPVSPPAVSDRAAFARAETTPPTAVPIRPTEAPARDNLQRIGGITAELEQKLNALGVVRYSQIAQWSPADVERFDKELQLGGRISRGNWIEQAHILSRGGDTAFSREFDRRGGAPSAPPPRPIRLPDAIRAHEAAKAAGKTDLSGLRSVRSEAYHDTGEPGPEAARRAAARKIARTGPPDDLKRIRGIGVLIERRLNALGVTHYEDIANWTADDIDRISQQLEFKGRIQREGWVEQARILAAGGDTEFSRRLDRERSK